MWERPSDAHCNIATDDATCHTLSHAVEAGGACPQSSQCLGDNSVIFGIQPNNMCFTDAADISQDRHDEDMRNGAAGRIPNTTRFPALWNMVEEREGLSA